MKKILTLILLSSIFLLAQANLCKANAQETSDFVQRVFNDSISISKDKKLSDKEKENQFTQIINKSVDTHWIARFVIGKYWRQITEAEQEKFIDLYQSFLIKTYIPKFQNYSGGDIKVNKVIHQKKNVYFVQAEFNDETGQLVNIDFRVTHKDDKMFITDIIAEGISFIVTQRSEVNSSISNKGFDNFLKHLEEMQK